MIHHRTETLGKVLYALCVTVLFHGQPAVASTAASRASVESEEYQLEAIRIEGAERTDPDLIRSLLLLKPGQRFSEVSAQNSRLRLLSLGLFIEVRMRLEKGSRRGHVIWILSLEEHPPLVVSTLFLGEGAEGRFAGGARLLHLNLMGRGGSGSLAFAQAGEGSGGIELGWSQPAFGPERIVLEGSLFGSESSYLLEEPQHDAQIRVQRGGANLGLGFRTQGLSLLSFRVRMERIRSLDDPDVTGDPDLSLAGRSSLISSLSIGFDHDRRNRFYLPDEGLHLSVWLEQGLRVLGGDYDFTRIEGLLEHYTPAWRDHYVRTAVSVGWVSGAPPFFDRYTESQVFRGIGYAPFLGVAFERETPREAFGKVSLDYSVPLYSGKGRPIYSTQAYLFLDFGQLVDEALEKDWDPRLVLGPGMALDTRYGTFRFHFGAEVW